MPSLPPARLPGLDALRGGAILAMFGYHFAWDLTLFGWADWPVQAHAGWLAYRTAVLSGFLAISGMALALAMQGGVRLRRFALRLGRLLAAAGAVSLATYLALPQVYVVFGVLHCLAATSLIGLALSRLSAATLLCLAAIALALPAFGCGPAFAEPWLNWLGLAPEVPASLDHVPLLPWLAPYLAGLALGRHLPAFAWRPAGRLTTALAWAGRHGLLLYLAHQPVFLGLLAALAWAGVGRY